MRMVIIRGVTPCGESRHEPSPGLTGAQATARRVGTLPLSPVARAAGTHASPASDLLDGGRELVIRHQGGEYHLRLTRNDKLILTK